MRKEKEFSAFVLSELSKLITTDDINLKEGQNILTDVTCVFEKNSFKLIHGFSQVDIAIYVNRFFEHKHSSLGLIEFYGDKEIKKGIFTIPLVVLELKCGDVTTDSIRSRDIVASRIKDIFPFSAYYFLAENTKKEEKTLLRQGKSFTNYFITKNEFNSDDIRNIYVNYIKQHLENIDKQFGLSLI